PKLRGHFAEFLNESSLDHLRLLASPPFFFFLSFSLLLPLSPLFFSFFPPSLLSSPSLPLPSPFSPSPPFPPLPPPFFSFLFPSS
ncbi:hypothetical protein ACXWR7_11500, partial [Streptococcus pyogenes]